MNYEKGIDNITVNEMRKWAGEGVQRWLFGLGRVPHTLFNLGGHNFLELYYLTQAYRCPDPEGETFANRERGRARRECLHHLREEISIVRPRVVLAFGTDALRSVRDVLSPETPIKEISKLKALFESKTIFEWNNVRVFPMVHPNGYWKSPSISTRKYHDIVRWYIEQQVDLRC